jgi:anthranilate synthase component 2
MRYGFERKQRVTRTRQIKADSATRWGTSFWRLELRAIARTMLLLIDNFDSFAHNLARYLRRLGQDVCVLRNDVVDADTVERLRPQAVVLSPGPCAPQQAGGSLDVVRHAHQQIPMLGVCLGHQIIAEALGGRIVRAPEPVHGRTSPVVHDGTGIFAGLPNPLVACRYHSLVVDEGSLPPCLCVNARTPDGIVMAIEHRQLPVVGVQFHPESILTQGGYALLAAFLRRCGLPVARQPDGAEELAAPSEPPEVATPWIPAGVWPV